MRPNEFLTSLGSLANASGLAELQQHLHASGDTLTPEEASNLHDMVKNVIRNAPKQQMENVEIRVGPTPGYGGAATLPQRGLISIEPRHLKNPALLAHEAGHIESVRESGGGVYKSIQDFSRNRFKEITQYGTVLSIPAAIGILALAKNPASKKRALNILTGLAAAAAAPTLIEEVVATRKALQNVPERARDARALSSGIKDYAWAAAKPMAVLQLAKLLARK